MTAVGNESHFIPTAYLSRDSIMKHRKRKNKQLINELIVAFEHTDRMKQAARQARQARHS